MWSEADGGGFTVKYTYELIEKVWVVGGGANDSVEGVFQNI